MAPILTVIVQEHFCGHSHNSNQLSLDTSLWQSTHNLLYGKLCHLASLKLLPANYSL